MKFVCPGCGEEFDSGAPRGGSQVACPQCLHRSERNSVCRCGYSPRVASTTQSRLRPAGTWFSFLLATTQSPQPMQAVVSITMA